MLFKSSPQMCSQNPHNSRVSHKTMYTSYRVLEELYTVRSAKSPRRKTD